MLLLFIFLSLLLSFGYSNKLSSSFSDDDEIHDFFLEHGSYLVDEYHNIPLTFLTNEAFEEKSKSLSSLSFLEVLNKERLPDEEEKVNSKIDQDKENKEEPATNFIVVRFKSTITTKEIQFFIKKYKLKISSSDKLSPLVGPYHRFIKHGLINTKTKRFNMIILRPFLQNLRNDPFIVYVHVLTKHKINLNNERRHYQHHMSTETPVPSFKLSTIKDPKYPTQMNLKNSKVPQAWELGFNGKNILIAIVDDGVDWSNNDIRGRFNAKYYMDLMPDTPFHPSTAVALGAFHGTQCASVAGASMNNHCGVGVAYNATFTSIRLPFINGQGYLDDYDIAKIFNHANNDIDIYSNSWGIQYSKTGGTIQNIHPEIHFALKKSATDGRSKKGNIIVASSGNDGEANSNTNYGRLEKNRYTIVVSALNKDRKYDGTSTIGNTVWVSASTGDYGSYVGNYCFGFAGTSAAVPVVSGIAALMLQANPELTSRDVRDILARTAIKVDIKDKSWQMNGAGLHVSEKFGFGMVNALDAVRMSIGFQQKGYTLPKSNQVFKSPIINAKMDIPDSSDEKKFLQYFIVVEKDFLAEHADLYVNLKHQMRGNVEILLISPSGTKCFLTHSHDNIDDTDVTASWEQRQHKKFSKKFYLPIDGARFACSHIWRESVKGTWKLELRDKIENYIGKLVEFQLTIYGFKDKKIDFTSSPLFTPRYNLPRY